MIRICNDLEPLLRGRLPNHLARSIALQRPGPRRAGLDQGCFHPWLSMLTMGLVPYCKISGLCGGAESTLLHMQGDGSAIDRPASYMLGCFPGNAVTMTQGDLRQ